jgi:hypothetical protein
MKFKRREGRLLLEILASFYPHFLAFVGLIDHVLADGHFSVVEESLELLVYERDKVGWELPR